MAEAPVYGGLGSGIEVYLMTLDDLLVVPYAENGREPDGSDCYGLTRLARTHLYGKPWMPLRGSIESSDKRGLTRAMLEDSKRYQQCAPKPGAIAAAFRGSLCIHIAIVVDLDGRLMILETDEPGQGKRGPRLVSIRRFKDRFLKVEYYDN